MAGIKLLCVAFVLILTIHCSHQYIEQSDYLLEMQGSRFIPSDSQESILNIMTTLSIIRCAEQCHQHLLCRVFVHDRVNGLCQLYRSSLSWGSISYSSNYTTRVGQIRNTKEFFINYNRTCDHCPSGRYLTCQNNRCECPLYTYWNDEMCVDQLRYHESCNKTLACRTDLNLSCIFGSCQYSSAICPVNATAITFDDIDNSTVNGIIPTNYRGLQWTNGKYLQTSSFPGTGYEIILNTGNHVCWFNSPLTVETTVPDQTFQLSSFLIMGGWSNSLTSTITGYHMSTMVNTVTISISRYSRTTMFPRWKNLTKFVIQPGGSGYYDTALEDLCLTF